MINVGENNPNEKTLIQSLQNGVDRLFKKQVVQTPSFMTGPQVEQVVGLMWNAIQSGQELDEKTYTLLSALTNNEVDDVKKAWKDLSSGDPQREFKTFNQAIIAGRYSHSLPRGDGAWFKINQPINDKSFKLLVKKLSQFEDYNHPVAKGHNPNLTGDDSYMDNAQSKMLIKMRKYWEELDRIKDIDVQLYIDSLHSLIKPLDNLYADCSAYATQEDFLHNYPGLAATIHADNYAGYNSIVLCESQAEHL